MTVVLKVSTMGVFLGLNQGWSLATQSSYCFDSRTIEALVHVTSVMFLRDWFICAALVPVIPPAIMKARRMTPNGRFSWSTFTVWLEQSSGTKYELLNISWWRCWYYPIIGSDLLVIGKTPIYLIDLICNFFCRFYE